uniref:Reverse transcriptase Ty1/copia-type domain-containing protein n=1 Tax=Tanacetum cinerariifolium TaxID=118510 RepID=A0A6L2MLA9_TANCI|nr:hypothetical protein [Tanacetum cinerariifolium]
MASLMFLGSVMMISLVATVSCSENCSGCSSTNSSSQATNFLITSQNVDELNSQQQHAQQQGNQAHLQSKTVADNVPNAMFDGNTFVNPFANPSTSAAESSSSQNVDPSNMHTFYQPYPHEFQWTKDHPLEQNIKEAMTDPAWIESMQEELLQFKRLDVWVDFNGMIDYAIVVVELESISDGYRDSYSGRSHVYKLKKALYGLKQAPRAWYDELLMFLLHNHSFKGTIDPTLFIRCFHNDILVVQVCVDDIIFGSTHPRYIQLFSDLMKSRFEMSMMGEMTFFLGLQVNQSSCGIFINQSKYVLEILKKYEMKSCDPVGTPMEIKDKLDLDQNGTPVDATKYRSMIGALMYLTSSRPDIVHATCLCARYQAKPTEKHLKEMLIIRDVKTPSRVLPTQLTDYGFHFNKIPIYCDSKSAITISCNLVQHSRTKHIAVRYHFIKEYVQKGTIELYFVKMDYQLANLFTKALLADRLNYLVRRLGMSNLSPRELDRFAKSQ